MLPYPVSDLYVSCDACEVGRERGPGFQFLFGSFGDLMARGMIVQPVEFLSPPPPASCSQILLSTWQG